MLDNHTSAAFIFYFCFSMCARVSATVPRGWKPVNQSTIKPATVFRDLGVWRFYSFCLGFMYLLAAFKLFLGF